MIDTSQIDLPGLMGVIAMTVNDGAFQFVDDKGQPGNGALNLTNSSFSGTVNHSDNESSVPAILEGEQAVRN